MRHEAFQQHTKGAPLTNYTPTHLNMPKKWHNKVLGANCADQDNQHFQPLSQTQKQPSIHDFITKMIIRVGLVLIPNGETRKKKKNKNMTCAKLKSNMISL